MDSTPTIDDFLAKLNPEQRAAATHGDEPLLIVAGAGTGKTTTLVHRVAWWITQGVDPAKILLLTFTRRSAAEMLSRVENLLRQLDPRMLSGDFSARVGPAGNRIDAGRIWGGTFHAVAARLLRQYGKAIGLPPDFLVHDRSDAEDLLNLVRSDLGLAKTEQRFPKKGTCMDIYSRCVNSRQKLEQLLPEHFGWCKDWVDELKQLFSAYVDRKDAGGVLDYDDLLLYWHGLLADPTAGEVIRKQFDCVLVDEYQDTNALQSDLLYLLSPEGRRLTVVGDDAQSIYSFRAATVRNILDFPKQYSTAQVIKLEQNYRSTGAILEATNRVVAQAKERFAKNLWSARPAGEKPEVVTCADETDQTNYVIRRILEHREAGIALRRQAVLFRTSHHSMDLEAELTSRNIPFHKYGGLKLVEAAHVKDLLSFLRLAENPRDEVAAGRLLPLIPGIGPVKARQLTAILVDNAGNFDSWAAWTPPAAAAEIWPKLVDLLNGLAASTEGLESQIHRVRKFYAPLLETRYDHVVPRLRDLEQIEQIAGRYPNRQRMLQEMALDPPNSTQDLAGPPMLDDDYLVLSTIHSAKGLEWDAVYVLHAADGNIPSDMSTKNAESIEEELRLFYVALTRAKNSLSVMHPLKYYHTGRPGVSDRYGMSQRTRFLPEKVLKAFDRKVSSAIGNEESTHMFLPGLTSQAIRGRAKKMWE
jgi:DNA helicase-2/ATP-dependent DNA helicase PcrA